MSDETPRSPADAGDVVAAPTMFSPWGSRWSVLLRVTALAVWVAALDLWLARHFHSGVGLDQLLLTFAGIPAVSVVAAGVLGFLLDDEEQKALKSDARRVILRRLSLPLLILLYLTAGAVALFRSTLTIVPAADPQSREVLIAPILRPGDSRKIVWSTPGEPLDVGLWINPYAPEYRVTISGYLAKEVVVKPFVGTTLVPQRDLVLLPTVLLRPSPNAFTMLGNDGYLVLYRFAGGTFKEVAKAKGGHSRYAGPARPQPTTLAEDWRRDLDSAGEDKQSVATLMKWWLHPAPFATPVALSPGDRVCALVANVDGQTYAGTVRVIDSSDYTDLFIGDIEDGQEAFGVDRDAACGRLDGRHD